MTAWHRLARRTAVVTLLLALSGCAGQLNAAAAGAAASATQSSAAQLDTTQIKKELDSVGASIATSAVDAARSALLDPKTEKLLDERLRTLVVTLGKTLRAELLLARDSLFDAQAHEELRSLVRSVVDEALGERTLAEVDAFRDRATGAPLQANGDALVAGMLKTLQSQTSAAVSAETARYRDYLVGFGVAILLLLGLAVRHEFERRGWKRDMARMTAIAQQDK